MGNEREDIRVQLLLATERASSFSGWDFRQLSETPLAPLPWDYSEIARAAAVRARRVLDLGTGGGERFQRILGGLSCRAVATEAWERNVPVAARTMAGRADVVAARSHQIPFRDGCFDLVLSRHEAIEPAEVARVLTADGTFLTQQVGHDAWPELRAIFPEMTDFGDHGARYRDELRGLGFEVELRRAERPVRYGSLADFAFLVLLVDWPLPGHDAMANVSRWQQFAMATGDREGGIVVSERKYLLRAVPTRSAGGS